MSADYFDKVKNINKIRKNQSYLLSMFFDTVQMQKNVVVSSKICGKAKLLQGAPNY